MAQLMEDKLVRPSAGRALSVLVAVCAVLWVWHQGPEWYWANSTDKEAMQGLRKILHGYFMVVTLLVGSNGVVWRWATQPLWRSLRTSETGDLGRTYVLVLAITFHLAFLLLILFAGLALLLFSGGVPFF